MDSNITCGVCYSECSDFITSPIYVTQKHNFFTNELDMNNFIDSLLDDETVGDIVKFSNPVKVEQNV